MSASHLENMIQKLTQKVPVFGLCAKLGTDLPAVTTAAGARAVATPTGPRPGAGSGTRARPRIERN